MYIKSKTTKNNTVHCVWGYTHRVKAPQPAQTLHTSCGELVQKGGAAGLREATLSHDISFP